jgi:hypothetical protein
VSIDAIQQNIKLISYTNQWDNNTGQTSNLQCANTMGDMMMMMCEMTSKFEGKSVYIEIA